MTRTARPASTASDQAQFSRTASWEYEERSDDIGQHRLIGRQSSNLIARCGFAGNKFGQGFP